MKVVFCREGITGRSTSSEKVEDYLLQGGQHRRTYVD